MSTLPVDAAERRLLPDPLIRLGIRRLLRHRLRDAARPGASDAFIASLPEQPIALVPDQANAQHYEVPPQFFELVLGPRRKYSCCLFEPPSATLAQAEDAMLKLTCERAGIQDGMRVLDLGCGWGAATLWIAEQFPNCRVLAMSNSTSQRESILSRARRAGLDNVNVLTADINAFDPGMTFDRIVSVEMLEHTRNLPRLLGRVASWLQPDGRFFAHIFCHDRFAYPYDDRGDGDWMARNFFSGGMMPSYDLLPQLAGALTFVERWRVSGTHYAQTCCNWLDNVDANYDALLDVFTQIEGASGAPRAIQRWRIFFMACQELFAFHRGHEWFVGHYLFGRNE